MIVFIADYPTVEKLRDGMVQRVAAIDTLAEDQTRVYLDISFKRNVKRRRFANDNCTIEHLNYFLHFNIINKYIKNARLIYVHSLYNLLKVHFLYDANKTILDIHGVVPEEIEMINNNNIAKIYHAIEKRAIRDCSLLIHVTNSMLEYYEEKYSLNLRKRSLVLPIFEYNNVSKDDEKWHVEQIKIVYVGGMQAWQNVDLMMDNVRHINNSTEYSNRLNFSFFFPSALIPTFYERFKDVGNMDNVSVGSLPKNEILPFLSGCHLGFVLRDSIIVNRVACPTKIIEYLECGVVPIVKSSDIGDFKKLGYKYIEVNEISSILDLSKIKKMSEHNYGVLDEFHQLAIHSKNRLRDIFSSAVSRM